MTIIGAVPDRVRHVPYLGRPPPFPRTGGFR
jgi:hypothetical protein